MKDLNDMTPPEPAFGLPEMTEDDLDAMAGEENHSSHWARPLAYARLGCHICEKESSDLNFVIELKLSVTQLEKAERWAKENGYDYKGNVQHLLMDWALKERVDWRAA